MKEQLIQKIMDIAERLPEDQLKLLIQVGEYLLVDKAALPPDAGLVLVELTFLSQEEGGKKHPPMPPWGRDGIWYMPHLVVDGQSEYLGVRMIAGPELSAGQSGAFVLSLMYPQVDYSLVIPGAKVTMREGGKTIGKGVVVQRTR